MCIIFLQGKSRRGTVWTAGSTHSCSGSGSHFLPNEDTHKNLVEEDASLSGSHYVTQYSMTFTKEDRKKRHNEDFKKLLCSH